MSDDTQTAVIWEAFTLHSFSEMSHHNSVLGTSWQQTLRDGKSIFLVCFIWFRPWRTQGACESALGHNCLFTPLVSPWMWLEIMSRSTAPRHKWMLCSSEEWLLRVCVCSSLPRRDVDWCAEAVRGKYSGSFPSRYFSGGFLPVHSREAACGKACDRKHLCKCILQIVEAKFPSEQRSWQMRPFLVPTRACVS